MTGEAHSELRLAHESQAALLTYARAALGGETQDGPGDPLPDEIRRQGAPVILCLFDEEGGLRACARGEPETAGLAGAVDHAAAKVRRDLGPSGSIDSLYIHLLVVTRTARFPNFGIAGLFDSKVYEPRVTGLAYELAGARAELNPIEALCLDLDSKGARARLARVLGIEPKAMPLEGDLEIEIYRTLHVGERFPDRSFASFHRGHLAVTPEEVTPQRVLESLRLIGCWYRNNVIDSQVTYLYSPTRRRFENDKRTIVRSTMAAWILNRLAVFLDDAALRSLGQETVTFYLQRYFQMERSLRAGALRPSPEPLANGYRVQDHYTSAAFVAAAILERGELGRYESEVRLLIDWCLEFQKADGTLWTPWAQNQFFMPGQLMLVLAYLHRETREPRFRRAFESIFAAYEEPYEQLMALGPDTCTPYAPGWVSQPLVEMFLQTGKHAYQRLVVAINDRILRWYEDNARHQAYPDYDGILAPKPGYYGNVSITAAALESLTEGARLANAIGDHDRLARYQLVIRKTVAYLLRLQYAPANTYYLPNRELVIGGFKKSLTSNVVWCDSIWHTASALMKIHQGNLVAES